MLVIVEFNGRQTYVKVDDECPSFTDFVFSVFEKFNLSIDSKVFIFDKERILIDKDVFSDILEPRYKFFIEVVCETGPIVDVHANEQLLHLQELDQEGNLEALNQIPNSAQENLETSNICQNLNESVDLFAEETTETSFIPVVSELAPPLQKKPLSWLKTCPICNKVVKELSKHLVIHNIDSEDKSAILYSQRKRRSPLKKNMKLRFCPFDDCKGLKPHIRLDQHLKRKHQLRNDSPYFRQLIGVRQTRHNPDICNNKTKVIYSDFSQAECKKYGEYLMTLSGGNLNERESKQLSYRIRQILHGTDAKEIEFILKSECSTAVEQWLQLYCKKNESSSAITYCSTWISYLNYVKKKIFPEQCALIRNMIDTANDWKRPFRKMRSLKDKSIDYINVEDITAFRNGESFKKGMDVMFEFRNGRQTMITRAEHSHLRNCLIMVAAFRNAGRACALSNLTVAEFNAAASIEDEKYGQMFVILVHYHKTVLEHGPAEVVLSKDYYQLYLSYKFYIRTQIVRFNVNDWPQSSFFLTWSGNSISSDDLIHGIQTTWASSGFTSKLTTSAIRKRVTTIVHKTKKEKEKESLASHLKHRLSTAVAHYKEQNTMLQSLEGSNLVFESLGGQLPEISKTSTSNSQSESKFPLYRPNNFEEDVAFDIPQSEIFVDNPHSETMDLNVVKREKGNPYYTLEERALLNIVFNDFIECNRVPTLRTIRDVVEKDQRLVSLVQGKKCLDTKIKGCLQNLVNKKIKQSKKK